MNPLSSIDENFQEKVWESKIPLKIEMALCDLVSSSAPLTIYVSLPRLGYISSIFGDIMKSFENCISANLSDIWLEYNKIPIRWQYPLGVIVDSLNIHIEDGPIPIFVHVRSMPTDQVLKYENLDTLRIYYINSLKEANLIKFPKDNKILHLNTKDTDMLKKIVYSNDEKMLKEYRIIMNVINGNGFEKINRYPVRIMFAKTTFMITKPIELVEGEDPMKLTIRDYLDKVLGKETVETLKTKCKIIVHGIEVEESMRFLFYYLNFSYMDNFLYICFVEH